MKRTTITPCLQREGTLMVTVFKRILFLLLIPVLTGLSGCQNNGKSPQRTTETSQQMSPDAKAITRILADDEQLGAARNHACEDTTLAVTIRRYVAAIDALDFGDCPEDFTAAFRKHRDAWAAAIGFFEEYDDRRGEMHDLFSAIQEEDQDGFDQALQPITDTWTEVETLARRYGALSAD